MADVNPKEMVAAGYDQIALQGDRGLSGVRAEERRRYTAFLLQSLSTGSEVLELGCGAGRNTTRQLAERFSVTAVDISPRQISLARANAPKAQFIQADMAMLEFLPSSFNAVAAFYSIFHLPRREHTALLQRIASWLRPGGLLVATMGAQSAETDVQEDWRGVSMFWSSYDAEENQRLVQAAGLRLVAAKEETAIEFGKAVTFLWVVAEKSN